MGEHRFDVLIVTALLEELDAVLELGEGGRGGWRDAKDGEGYPYHHRTIGGEDGRALLVAAAAFDRMGAEEAAALIKELNPGCLAMCGICAGNKKEVSLGDVIVADRVYRYDRGKLVARREGKERIEELYRDIETYNLQNTWRVDAAYFARDARWTADLVAKRPPQPPSQDRWLLRAVYDHTTAGGELPSKRPERRARCPDWTSRVRSLRARGLLEGKPGLLGLTEMGRNEVLDDELLHPDGHEEKAFHIHVGPIATGEKVVQDPDLFGDLERFVCKTVGVEMEAPAIGRVGAELGRKAIIVKGVSDYGDGGKDDSFRGFATKASAEVLIWFLMRRFEHHEWEGDDARGSERGEIGDPLFFRDGSARGDDFLSHVERACRLKVGDSATIEHVRAPLPFGSILLVSTLDHGKFPRIYPVGAIEQVNNEALDTFLRFVEDRYRASDPGMSSTLVYRTEAPSDAIVHRAERQRVRLQSFVEYQGLIDFRNYSRALLDRLEKDPIYPPNLYVDHEASFSVGSIRASTDSALSDLASLLESPHGRFVLVLGDFGAGKTFLLHELARRLAKAEGSLVPVLVELRALEKAAKLDALIAQHLSVAGISRIDLDAFRYMLSEGRIALLFDGFDELALRVSYERATEHFDTLIQAAQGQAKVVVTSRTQHFFADEQVMTVLGQRAAELQGYRLAKLSPFDARRIRQFLLNRLENEAAAEKRYELLDEVEDLLGLSKNPRLLGFIAEIPEEQLREAKAKAKDGTITSAGLYELLLDRWIVHEFDRAHPRGAPPGLDAQQRWKAVRDLANHFWEHTERTVSARGLPEGIVGAVRALSRHEMDAGVVRHQIGSGTLLVRDDEGNFSFIHQSVMEWLVALCASEEIKGTGEAAALAMREISPLMADFVWGLAGRDQAEAWAQRVLWAKEAGEAAIKNALLMLKRLGVEAKGGLKLAGQDLTGQSFARRNLRYADMTRAILAGASLAGTDLTGATLVRAKLEGADLSRANLERANLREAHMPYARLLGANLRGANLAGANFREAKLIGAQVDPNALDDCNVFGAALPEHRPAVMVSAAAVCHCLAYSPDRRLLATGHDHGSIHLWDVASGTEIRILTGHAEPVRSVAFSPDSASLASGSSDSTLRLWDSASGAELRVLKGHLGPVWSVAFSPDGTSLASGSSDATVRLWACYSGAELRVLRGHSRRVISVAFSPDGASLACGSDDFTMRLWASSSGNELRVLKGHSGPVTSVAFSPDGASLASGSSDATVRLWDLASGKELHVLKGHSGPVTSVAFSPDGASLAGGSDDSTVRLWDSASGKGLRVLRGHLRRVTSVAFSPDSASLAGGYDDSIVCVWDAASGKELRVLKGHSRPVYCVAFSPDGASLASGSDDAAVHLWDSASGAELRVLKGHSRPVYCVAFSPDGASLASGSDDSTVRLWDSASGKQLRILKEHSLARSVAFSPDGTSLASGSDDSTVRLWDSASGNELRVLKGHSRRVTSVAFSPDGASLASGSWDSTVRLWTSSSGAEIRVLQGHSQPVTSVAFSPTGASLASGSYDKTVRLWTFFSGAELRVLQGHSQPVTSVAFSPTGASLASGSWDSTVRLWACSSGAELRILKGHSQGVYGVTYSPDGTLLASASSDGTIRLWDVASGSCLAVLLSLPEGWVAFTPDGRFRSGGVITGGFWHVIGLCRFEPGELDPYLPSPLRVPDGEPLYRLPGLPAGR